MVIISKALRYITKQSLDIAKYGKKRVVYQGVNDEILKEFTPFRRLSNKKGTLSDPKYFIEKFERETNSKFLPENWNTLSDTEKCDLIVKDRYSKLVSNKIMNKIQNEETEHLFCLTPDGDIAIYNHGDSGFCSDIGIKGGISIHNHPGYLKTSYSNEELNFINKNYPERLNGIVPFSSGDIIATIKSGERAAYVVDSQGHKFLFKPRTYTDNKQKTRDLFNIKFDLNDIEANSFPSKEIQNERIKNVNKLLADLNKYQEKQRKYGKLFYPQRGINKRLDKYLQAKTDALSLQPFSKVKEEFQNLSQTYGFKFEQLS